MTPTTPPVPAVADTSKTETAEAAEAVPAASWTPPRRLLATAATAYARWRGRPDWYRNSAWTAAGAAAVAYAWLWETRRWAFCLAAVLAVSAVVLAARRRRRTARHRNQVAAVWAGIAAVVGHARPDGTPDPHPERWLHVPAPSRRLPEGTRPGRLAVRVLSRGVLPAWPDVRVRGHVLIPGHDPDTGPRISPVARRLHEVLMSRAVAACVIQGHIVRHFAFRPKAAATIGGVLNTVYPDADLEVSIDVTAQTWAAWPKPRPPAAAELGDSEITELVERDGSATRLLAGLTASGPVWLDLDGETPHVGMSIGTGGGKSSLFRLLGAQVWYHGAERIDIVDPKRISLDAFKGIPGIHIWRDVELQISAVERFKEEMDRRYKILEEDPDAEFPRRFLFMEEMNSWTDLVTIHHRQNKEPGDPARPPVLDIFALCLYQGRQAGMHVFVALQQANARATGGSALRDQLGAIFLARHSVNVWNFLTGNQRPVRRASKHPGRAVLVVTGDVTDIQMVFASPAAARAFALRRGQPATGTEGDVQESWTADIPGTLTRAVLDMASDTDTERGDAPPRITLPDACRAGVVGMTVDAARKARMRDEEFPRGEGAGRNQTYTEQELREWFANRAR